MSEQLLYLPEEVDYEKTDYINDEGKCDILLMMTTVRFRSDLKVAEQIVEWITQLPYRPLIKSVTYYNDRLAKNDEKVFYPEPSLLKLRTITVDENVYSFDKEGMLCTVLTDMRTTLVDLRPYKCANVVKINAVESGFELLVPENVEIDYNCQEANNYHQSFKDVNFYSFKYCSSNITERSDRKFNIRHPNNDNFRNEEVNLDYFEKVNKDTDRNLIKYTTDDDKVAYYDNNIAVYLWDKIEGNLELTNINELTLETLDTGKDFSKKKINTIRIRYVCQEEIIKLSQLPKADNYIIEAVREKVIIDRPATNISILHVGELEDISPTLEGIQEKVEIEIIPTESLRLINFVIEFKPKNVMKKSARSNA